MAILLKRLGSRATNWNSRGQRCVAQPISGALVCINAVYCLTWTSSACSTYQPAKETFLVKCEKLALFGFLLEYAVCPFKLYRHDASQVSTKKRDLAILWRDRQNFCLIIEQKAGWLVGMCSVYLGGTRSKSEGCVSTPACYLLL